MTVAQTVRGVITALLAGVMAACTPQSATSPTAGPTVAPTFVPLTRVVQEPTDAPLPTVPPTEAPTGTPTHTLTPTVTLTPSDTPTPTETFTDAPTVTPSDTPTVTRTPFPSFTPLPTATASPTFLPLPPASVPPDEFAAAAPQSQLLFETPTPDAAGSELLFATPTPAGPDATTGVSVFSTQSGTDVLAPQSTGATGSPQPAIFTTPTPLPTATPIPSPTRPPPPTPRPRPVPGGQEVDVPIYGAGNSPAPQSVWEPGVFSGTRVPGGGASFRSASTCGANAWFATDIRIETCPDTGADRSSAAFQRFEYGAMFWLEDTRQVYAFVLSGAPPRWTSYPAVWQPTNPGCTADCSTWTQDNRLRLALGEPVDRYGISYVANYQIGQGGSIAIADTTGSVYYGGSSGLWSLRLAP